MTSVGCPTVSHWSAGQRYATERVNTTRMKSGGLLGEVLCQHLSDMGDAPSFTVGLMKGRKATKKVQTRIRSSLELSGNVVVDVARSSWNRNLSLSCQGDFVLFRDQCKRAGVGIPRGRDAHEGARHRSADGQKD